MTSTNYIYTSISLDMYLLFDYVFIGSELYQIKSTFLD